MIVLSEELNRSEARILAFVGQKLASDYPELDIRDDCKNLLHYRIIEIRKSDKFLACTFPKAYMTKSLLREGQRLYKRTLKTSKRFISNDCLDANEIGEQTTCDRNVSLIADVNSFIESLSEEDQIICNAVMQGATGADLGNVLRVSGQHANRKRRRFLKQAKPYFGSYEYDCD